MKNIQKQIILVALFMVSVCSFNACCEIDAFCEMLVDVTTVDWEIKDYNQIVSSTYRAGEPFEFSIEGTLVTNTSDDKCDLSMCGVLLYRVLRIFLVKDNGERILLKEDIANFMRYEEGDLEYLTTVAIPSGQGTLEMEIDFNLKGAEYRSPQYKVFRMNVE